MLWRVLRDIFTTGTRHTDIYLKNSSVLPFWQDNYVDDDDDAEYEDVWWTIKMNNKNQIMPSTVVKFELITDWQIW